MKRKRPNPRKLLDAMPHGRPLERIARNALQAVGTWQLRYFEQIVAIRKDQMDPLDPLLASRNMAAAFIPYIDAYIDEGGRTMLAELGQDDPGDWLVYNPQAIEAARTATLALCDETISTFLDDMNRTMDGIRQDLADSIASGETAGDAVDRLAKWVKDESRWRARRIAVTESARAFNAGAVASTEDLDFIAGYRWLLSDDACPMCHAVARLCPVIPKGGTFAENGKNPAYRNVKFPPLHPNCVLGETPVLVTSLVSATHVQYQGPIVRLVFGDGSDVTVTPNHMFLTDTGFARACDLVKGDDVIRACLGEVDSGSPFGSHPNKYGRPVLAKDVFRAFAESGGVSVSSVPVSAEYLHGDARFGQGKIDIVRATSLLRHNRNAFPGNPFGELRFVDGREDAIRFDGSGDLASVLESMRLATDSGMGSLREAKSILWGSVRHPLKHGFGSIPRNNSDLFQSANNHRAADAQTIGDTLDRFPGIMTKTKVVSVDFMPTAQDPISVYDFETLESMYIVSNGIVSSNCRCGLVTVFDDEVPPEWPKTVKPPVGSNYVIPGSDDIMAAEAGGYESVAIGNAKSIGGFVVLWE